MPNQSIKGSTQQFIEIEDIIDDIVLLRNGAAALIIETTAVNFSLLSESEQDGIIYAYAALLNSLSFPIQIIIRSKRMDVSSYIAVLDQKIQDQQNVALRHQMELYRNFIERTIKEKGVLDKRFYIVIPFSRLELGVGGAVPAIKKSLPFNKSYILARAKNALYSKRDNIVRQLGRLSFKATTLSTQRLAALFYEIFNPEQGGSTDIAISVRDYLSSKQKL